jgi:hypothetical protein
MESPGVTARGHYIPGQISYPAVAGQCPICPGARPAHRANFEREVSGGTFRFKLGLPPILH